MLTKNAIGNLMSRYKAVLKKCNLLNTFGSLAVVSMLVAGSVGVAYANNVNIAGIGDDTSVSLNADGGAPSTADTVTTATADTYGTPTSGTFNLNIDGRGDVPLNTMTIGDKALGGDLTVTLLKGNLGTTTGITSNTLSVVAGNIVGKAYDATYVISTGLTHTVNGVVSIQANEGQALLQVDGTLHLNTSAGGDAGTIERGSGNISGAHLYVNGTLTASDGNVNTDVNVNQITLTLNGATVNAASLNLDDASTLTLEGSNTINGNLNAGYNDIIIQGKDDGGAGESLTAASITTGGEVKILGGNAGANGVGADASLTLNGDGNITSSVTLQGGTANVDNTGGLAILNVNGAGKVISMSDLTANAGGAIEVFNGATLDISAVADLSKALGGTTHLSNNGILKVDSLTIAATDLIVDSPAAGKITFDSTAGGTLSVNDTLTLDSDTAEQTATLESGVNIETKTLLGGTNIEGNPVLGANLESGAKLTFSGGGSMGINVAANGIVNFQGTDTFGATTAANQTTIADDNILTVNAGSVVNVQNNGVLVLNGTARLALNAGDFNIANDGTLLLSGFDFDGKNITNIAGTVISVEDFTAASFNYKDVGLANVNLQAGAKLGSISLAESERDSIATILNDTITVDANSTGDNAATVFGSLRGNDVTVSDFNGILNVSANFLSGAGNTWGTAGDSGTLNIVNNANFYAGATDVFNVAFNANIANVYGGDGGDGDASVTVNAGGSLGALGATGVSLAIIGGDADDTASGGNAIFTVGGGEYTINGNVGFSNGATVAANTGGSGTLNVLGGTGTDATLTINGDIHGTGTLNIQGGDGGTGGDVAGAIGDAGGTAQIHITGTLADTITFNYAGGKGGTGGTVAGATGGAGGDVIISPSSGSYSLTGGTGGASNVGDGGAGGAVILQAAANSSYDTITLNGGTAGTADGSGAGGVGGETRFDVEDEASSVNIIKMNADGSSVVNVTSATAATDLTLLLIDGEGDHGGAAGIINIKGGNSSNIATLSVTDGAAAKAVYNDSAALVVNIGTYGTLDLTDAQVNVIRVENALQGAYNLIGGTLSVADLVITDSNFVSDYFASATAGQINFSDYGSSLLDVDGTLTVNSSTPQATIGTGSGGIDIQTQSLTGGTGVNGITIGDNDENTNKGIVLTFTDTGTIATALTVDGAANVVSGTGDAGGVVNIGSAADADGNAIIATTTATKDITINEYGQMKVFDGSTLTLQDTASIGGVGTLQVRGGTLNAVNAQSGAADLDLSAINVLLSSGGELGTAGQTVTVGGASFEVSDDSAVDIDGTILGTLVGDGVIAEIFSILNVAENYTSQNSNTFSGNGSINVTGDMNYTNGANDIFKVDIEANNVNVIGTNNLSTATPPQADASVTFAKNLTVTDTVNLTGGEATTANGGTTGMVVAGVLKAENINITGGANTGDFKGGGSQLVLDGGASSSITNLTVRGGDVGANTLTSSMNNAEFVAQALGSSDTFVEINGDVLIQNGANAIAKATYGQGIAAFIVAGGNYENGGAGKNTNVVLSGTVSGDGIIAVQGGIGETGGSGMGGDASLDLAGANLSGFTGTYSYLGGQGGNATNVAGGGAGGSVNVYGVDGQSYNLVGGVGGASDGAFDGGAGGDAVLNANDGDTYTAVTLNGGVNGVDADLVAAGLGGAGGAAVYSVTNESVTAQKILMLTAETSIVNVTVDESATNPGPQNTTLSAGDIDGIDLGAQGVINIAGTNDYTATLTVTGGVGSYIDTDALEVNIGLNGTLDLSNIDFGSLGNFLSGAYNLNGGTLNLGGLRIDATELVSGAAAAGEIGFVNGAKLDVDGILTIVATTDTAQLNDGVHIETQSLEGNITGSQGVAHILLGNDGSTVNSTLIFSGDNVGVIPVSNINTNLTIAGAGKMVVGYTLNDAGAVSMDTTTLGAGKSLTVGASDGLNILGGATLDVSGGTLTLNADGFAHLDPDEVVTSSILGKDGLGTLIVDNDNLGLASIAGNVSYDSAISTVDDAFWGTLQVTGLEGKSMTLEEYNKLLVGGENALIQGLNATLELIGVDVEGLFVLSNLESGTVYRDIVNIGTGLVDHGGTIIVGSVNGNLRDSIVVDNGSDLSITGEPDGGDVFTKAGIGDIQVKDGTLRLGGEAGKGIVTTTSLTLGADIILGDTADSSIEGDVATTGHVYIYSDLDMSGQTIGSFAGTSGNMVNVLGGGSLVSGFNLGANDALNVIADAANAAVGILNGSELGDINITGGTQAGADAVVSINGVVTAGGDVTLTQNAGDAILNIKGLDGQGVIGSTSFAISGNFINNSGIFNLTAGNATVDGAGGHAIFSVGGTFTFADDITLTGGDALGGNDGGSVSMVLANADLGNVDITSGTNATVGGTGIGGVGNFILSSGSVADVTLMNTFVGQGSVAFTVYSGAVTANSISLDAVSGARNSNLQVVDGGVLNVTALDASAGSIGIYSSDLLVSETYIDTAETLVTIDTSQPVGRSQTSGSQALFDLSKANISSLNGKYTIDAGGTLQMATLNIDSANLVSGAASAGQLAFDGGSLVTETLNLTDVSAASLDNGIIVTQSLDTANDVGVTVNTNVTFSGGGTIGTAVTTGTNSIIIGAVDGVDGGETLATTTTLGNGMALNINKNAGLLVREGHALDTTQGTLKIVAGGFAASGTGQLVANQVDFGTFNLDASTLSGLIDTSSANVQDLYFGDLVISGLTGTMSQEAYESFLIDGSNALILDGEATLKFDGVSVAYADDTEIGDLAAGTNAEDQTFKTGAPTTGTTVDVNNGGKVTVGGLEQTDPNNPVDLNIKTGTTLVTTGQGEAQGNAFDGSVNVESGAGFNTGVAGGQYVAKLNGDVTLESESFAGAGDGGKYTAVGDTEIVGDIVAGGTGGGQAVEVESGANLTVGGDVNLPNGSMTVQQGGSAVATDVTVNTLYVGDAGATDQTGSLTVKNLTANSGQIAKGAVTVTGTASLGDFTVGSPASQGLYSANETIISGIFGADPAWNADPALNTMDKATQAALGTVIFDAAATGDVGMYVGSHSMVAIGTSDTTAFRQDIQHLVEKGIVFWGNPADDVNNTSAGIAFYEGLTLTPNASLVVNGDYVNVASITNPAGVWELSDGTPVTFTANTASFAANSLTLIDAPAFFATDSVALTAGSGSELTVDFDAKLVIAGGMGGQYINVAEGFDTASIGKNSTTGETGWTADNLFSGSSLLGVEVVTSTATGIPSAYADSDFLVYLYSKDANVIYPELTNSMGNHINTMVDEIGTNVNSLNMGQRLISRLTDNSGAFGYGSERATEVASIIESSAQVAQVGAVGRVTMDAAMSAANASVARNTFSELGSNAQNVAAMHMDANGNISAGSKEDGMKNGVGLWLMPLYTWNNVNGFEAGSFDHDYTSGLGGMAIGADYTVNNMYRFGVNLNVGAGYADSTGDLSKTDNDFDFWGLGVYGAFFKNNLNVVADLGYSQTHNDLNQNVPGSLGMGNNSVEVDASAITLGLTSEYLIKTDAVDIIPHAGVRFVSVTTDGYDVKNSGGTVFNVESETQNVWSFPVGVVFQKEMTMDNGWYFTPNLDLGFVAAAGDLDALSKASIPGVSGAAELEMRNVDGFAFSGGLGINLGNDVMTFGVNYDIQASEHETSHMISGTFRFEF